MRRLLALLALMPTMAWADTIVETGPTFMLREPSSGVAAVWSERFPKWDVGMMLVTRQFLNDQKLSANAGFRVARVVRQGRLELGLGLGYWVHKSRAFGHKQVFELMAGLRLTDRVGLRYRHFSSAGQASPNIGQDMITVSWAFQ